MSNETELDMGGLKVKFPNKPYPSQLQLMSKIIKGLQNRQNCLLESPTGSGKTLALLVSALAWQKQEKVNIQKENSKILTKIRNACYCDCAAKKEKNMSGCDEIDEIKKSVKKRGEIVYDDEEEDARESSSEQDNNQCMCLCHGAYTVGVVESEDAEFVKPKK